MPKPDESISYRDIGFNENLISAIPTRRAGMGFNRPSAGNFIDNMSFSGNLGSSINVGGTNLRIEGDKGRIIINDGNNDRVIIGNLE